MAAQTQSNWLKLLMTSLRLARDPDSRTFLTWYQKMSSVRDLNGIHCSGALSKERLEAMCHRCLFADVVIVMLLAFQCIFYSPEDVRVDL